MEASMNAFSLTAKLAEKHAKRVVDVRYEIRDPKEFERHVANEVAQAILAYDLDRITAQRHALSARVVLLGWAIGAGVLVGLGLLAHEWPRAVVMAFLLLAAWTTMKSGQLLAGWLIPKRLSAGEKVIAARLESIGGQK
jgi:predicted membrane protein